MADIEKGVIQGRGRKRTHTEGEIGSPNAKRPKLAAGSSKTSQTQVPRRRNDRESRELTPAEQAHEKAIKERSLKYRRGDGKRPNVRLISRQVMLSIVFCTILTTESAQRHQRQAFEGINSKTRRTIQTSRR